ncbi:MAG TPA: autotransporter-associated beta strand repeat-containing protein, partial [Dyella sp.]|uniref:autotransporter-associated beta strand repeat-containing protein n=1 Tax=Dyella sp. TaxID=1869338 RepID=UPI002F95E8BC
GMDLNFWNANGLASSTQLGGGSGVWSQPNANWTDATGSITATRQPVNSFVIFGGASGTVTVDDGGGTQPVTTLGIQFASDGYRLNGDMLTLVGTVGSPLTELRVGDGSAGSAGWTATIDNVLSGAGINKTGLGTLVINGANTYTQTTELSAGALSVSSDANLGAASAGLDFEGGTLQVTGTAFNSTARAVSLGAGGGGFDIADAGNTFTLSGAIGGNGGLTKLGAGTLVLNGANTYSGGTTISAGTLQGNGASLQGNIADNAALVFDQNVDGTFTGAISGSGSVTKQGAGTLILNGANSYSGGTAISAGTLQGDSASLQGAIVDNAALVFQQSTDGTFNGTISGSGNLTKQGAGMLTLSGANSYSGGTTVAAGTLAGNTASLQGDIVDNATLAFNQGSDGTFAGTISGTGTLVKQGAATLTLTGVNSYSGGTTVSAGTLRGSTASLQGNIVDNATLAFDQASDGTFAGAISGIGTLVKLGAGTLILSGANSYGGGTTIGAGVLQGDSASLQGNIADNAALVFDQAGNGTFAGMISGSGTVTKQGAGTLILSGANTYTGGTTIAAGILQGDSSSLIGTITDNAALVFAQNSDGTFAGSIGGSGTLTKQGSGSLTLTGANPLTGATTVQAGTLIVGDAGHANASLASQVTVAAGATLGGVGSIGGLDLFGTIAPSSLTDPLNVQGNAVLHSGSTYQVGANADGQNTALVVGGTVTIQGGSVLAITQPGNYKPQTQYTIVTGAQGVSGQFAGVQASLTFLTPTLSYTANAVNLSLQRNAVNFVDVALTPNERNTATGLDGLNFDSPVYTALTLLDPVGARHALDQLSGEVHASTQTALFDSSQQIRGAVNQHLLGFGYGGQTMQGETGEGVSVWTTAWGHWDDHDANFNTSQMKSNGTGLVIGADLPLDQGRLGVLLARGRDSTRVDALASDTRTRSTYAGVYGGSEWGAFHLRGAAVYAWQDVRGHRFVSFPGYWQAANSDYDAHTAQAYLEGSYVIPLGRFTTLEPYAQLTRVQVHTDGFREQGGAADLSIDGATANQTLGTLGLRGSMTLGDSGLRGFAGLGWQHAWGDTDPSRNQRFVAGGPDFTIQGTAVASNAGIAELGLRMPLGRSAWLDAGYFGQFAGHANDQSARVTFTMSF